MVTYAKGHEPPAAESPKICFHEYALSAQSRMADLTGTLAKAIRWGLDSRDPSKDDSPQNWRFLLDQIGAVRGVLKDVEAHCAEHLTYTGLDRQPIVRDRLQQLTDKIGARELAYAMERLFTLDAVDLLKDQHFGNFVDWADKLLTPEVTSEPAAASPLDRRMFDRIPALIREHSEDHTSRGNLVVLILAKLQTLAGKNYNCAKSWLICANTANVENVPALVNKIRVAGVDGRRRLKESLEKAISDQSEEDDLA